MIVPMKKIHLIVQKKDVVSALETVRGLGLLHVEHQEELTTPRISDLKSEISTMNNVIYYLRQRLNKEEDKVKEIGIIEKEFESSDFESVKKVNEIVFLLSEIEKIKEGMSKRRIDINTWEAWGDFEPSDLRFLKESGVNVCLYESRVKDDCIVPPGVILEEIGSDKGVKRFVAISQKEIDLPLSLIPPPVVSLKEMKTDQKHDQLQIDHLEEELLGYIKFVEVFEYALSENQDALRFEETMKGMKDYGSLSLLRGYCPVDMCKKLEEKAKVEQWGIFIEGTKEGDNVPTLLKNPKWVEIIKPVFDIINVLPGYKEFDVSLVFLVFFTLFVGMLVGDAGYGLLVLAIFVGFHIKLASTKKNVPTTNLILVYLLCGCTIAWGILTGTFFGQQWVSSSFKPVVPWLLDDRNLQLLCFFIGTIHLSIAHLWNIIVKFPSLKALGDFGWMLIIWGMYAVAKFLVLDISMSFLSILFLITGSVFVVFFTKPNKNIFKSMGPGIGDILLNGINSFTDVVSYIRLYAVGLATVAVADAANEMSIGWIIILHTVNLILAGLAILVHGIRLNILEFSSNHLNIEWSGFTFNPFKKIQKTI